VIISNLVEEDLTAGKSNVEKKISVGEETFVLWIRHCCRRSKLLFVAE
jgi:hypothetical protein